VGSQIAEKTFVCSPDTLTLMSHLVLLLVVHAVCSKTLLQSQVMGIYLPSNGLQPTHSSLPRLPLGYSIISPTSYCQGYN
jgi:hypothetical protein